MSGPCVVWLLAVRCRFLVTCLPCGEAPRLSPRKAAKVLHLAPFRPVAAGPVAAGPVAVMLRRRILFGAAAAGFGVCTRALSLSAQPDLSFKARFRGQLGPPRPTAQALAAGATECGPLSMDDGVVYQVGAYSSVWIRVGCEPNLVSVSASALDVLVSAALAKQCTLPKPGAVYVALSEKSIDAAHVRCLLAKGFRFYHHRASPSGDDELVYYAWPDRPDYPDKVPQAGQSALARSRPRGYPPPRKATRLPRATLWHREERPRS